MYKYSTIVFVLLLLKIINCVAVFDPQNQLALVNQIRSDAGKPKLISNDCIMKAAQYQSDYQAKISESTHDSPYGGLYDRLTPFGISGMGGVAENVAAGYSSDASVVDGWKNSPGHYQNMIGDYVWIGMGMALKDGTPYWTQQFVGGTNLTCVLPTDPPVIDSSNIISQPILLIFIISSILLILM
ncbi:hypothetical protein DLAC_09021 [Tieghemostelium lacteum]|uniref:SCP domain-containing protein n=1 Tax=Tieghemostelium lacteum TaxID=361077 RepID=A0A151Z8X5_TIELA|nr:hypothetical protein DLAC_09021 [Tieghemostelium lacteum]|eukprot:KYQ90403.1 hypothetical protein DLAC_09021 [Tieghemostelium lacteum]